MVLANDLQMVAALAFKDLQAQRTKVYRDFNDGFQLFISKEASADQFKLLVQAVTRNFASISQQIQGLQVELKDSVFEPILANVQDLERKKLKVTVDAQTQETETAFGERDMSYLSDELKLEIESLIVDINELLLEFQSEMADLPEA